jgi:hypothetical protein
MWMLVQTQHNFLEGGLSAGIGCGVLFDAGLF